MLLDTKIANSNIEIKHLVFQFDFMRLFRKIVNKTVNKVISLETTLKKKYLCWSYTRPMINAVKDFYGDKELLGVEIGVLNGDNAYNILKILSIKKLYLVDPFDKYETYVGDNASFRNSSDNLKTAFAKLSVFKNKIEWLRYRSDEAYHFISDDLDFVYIDGNHSYNCCFNDISLYYPKIKKGGFIGGHDMCGQYKGVVNAVLDFAKQNNLVLKTKGVDWWFVK